MKKISNFLTEPIFESRTKLALDWIKRSFDIHSDGGSAAYYAQLWKPFGWQRSYPETTGYIIETLLDYDDRFPEMNLQEYALRAADWICTLQLEGGGLPGGLSGSKVQSVFNTGQMLIGLIRAYELTGKASYFEVFKAAANWLADSLEEDGSWRVGSYVEGYSPSYYTRVIWPLLWANQHLKEVHINDKMQAALSYYGSRYTPDRSIRDWSFRRGQKAFTHTIAYTIRGFYESSLLLKNDNLNRLAIDLAEKVLTIRETKGRLAGWYDEKWNGDYWFTCLTGNCQMSIIFSRVYEQTLDKRYLQGAYKVFEDVIPFQNQGGNVNKKGAIPGSAPFFGRYLTLRYPNWATKFFLDAYRILKMHSAALEHNV